MFSAFPPVYVEQTFSSYLRRAAMMAVEWNCPEDVRKFLTHKLVVLEDARKAVNEELYRFTDQTAKEVEDFLNCPCTTRSQDPSTLLNTVEAKCHVLKKLIAVFQDLESSINTIPDPESLKRHLPHKVGSLPQHTLQLRGPNAVFAPNVLKFGPLLQSFILSSSVTKAMQMFEATLSLPEITLSLESKCEDSSGKTSPNNATEIVLFDQDKCKVHEMEKANYTMQQKIVPTEAPRNTADAVIPKEDYPSFIQNIATYYFGQQSGNDHEIQQQKQTTSQLFHFLRRNGKAKKIRENSLFGAVNRGFMLTWQPKSKAKTIDQEGITLHNIQKRKLLSEVNVFGPTFSVKTSSKGCVTYSFVIATDAELWDVGTISTEVASSVQGSVSERLPVINCDDSNVFDLFGQTTCTSSDESVTSEQIEPQIVSQEPTEGTKEGDDFLVKIPEFQIKKFEEMPVFASYVVSPSKFYIQQGDANLQILSEVMVRTNCKSYAERNCIPDIGTYVMAWFPEQELWYRAQVTKICGMNRGSSHTCTSLEGVKNLELEVRRIDCGDSACLSLSNLKELCGEAAKVPLQALQVSLANVNPKNGQSWSVEATNWFKDKVNSRTLYARLYPEAKRVAVELFMEKGKIGVLRRGASLSLRLAQNGHAIHDQLKTMRLKRNHAHEQSRKQSMEWEKYLISCYSQNRK